MTMMTTLAVALPLSDQAIEAIREGTAGAVSVTCSCGHTAIVRPDWRGADRAAALDDSELFDHQITDADRIAWIARQIERRAARRCDDCARAATLAHRAAHPDDMSEEA